MTISFEGRVAVVTGSGGGIGRTHAMEIARRGGKVVVNDYGGDCFGRGGGTDLADGVVAEIREAGGTAVASYDSVATTAGANAIVAKAIEAFGKLDIVINNAGIIRNAHVAGMSDEDWDDVIATHLTGSFKVTRAAWPHMQAQGYGRVVMTCSSTAMFGIAMMANYAAAKGGIMGLVHALSHEGEGHGILVNAIMPNAATRMATASAESWEAAGEDDGLEWPDTAGNAMNPEFNMPIAVYLASEANSTTRGIYTQCLGRTAKMIIGVPPGWQAQRQTAPSVDDIAVHFGEICAMPGGFFTPPNPRDELIHVLSHGEATG
jgi:NAD(P)-dependent dehydrogenase (short-subunit alcohol dehydrogenase family)